MREFDTNYMAFAAYLCVNRYEIKRVYRKPRLRDKTALENRIVFELPVEIDIRELERQFRNNKTSVEPMAFADAFFHLKKRFANLA